MGNTASFDANEALLSGYEVKIPQWNSTAVPDMHQKRWLHAAVKLDDTRVLVIGGKDENSTTAVLNSCELYDSTSNSWQPWPRLTFKRHGHAAVLCQGTVYVLGGDDEKGKRLDSIEYLDLDSPSQEWQVSLDVKLTSARFGCTAVAIGPLIYVMGGLSRGLSSKLKSVDVLDVSTNTIWKGAPMKVSRYGATAVALENTIYVIGGINSRNETIDSIESLSVLAGQWQLCHRTMLTERWCASVTTIGDLLIIVGGSNSKQQLNAVEVLDTKRHVVWRLPNMTKKRFAGTAVVLRNRILAIGGSCKSLVYHSTEMIQLDSLSERDLPHNHWLESRVVRDLEDNTMDDESSMYEHQVESLEATVQSLGRSDEFRGIMTSLKSRRSLMMMQRQQHQQQHSHGPPPTRSDHEYVMT